MTTNDDIPGPVPEREINDINGLPETGGPEMTTSGRLPDDFPTTSGRFPEDRETI